MPRITTLIGATIVAIGLSLGVRAADTPPSTAGAKPAAATLSAGEVKQIDKSAGKITIKHGPLPNLEMPAMTMVFRVKEPAMLDQVKAGDKITFLAEKVNGTITVTQLELAK